MDSTNRVKLSWNILRYSYGAVILLAGLDKVLATNLIVEWSQYISPSVLTLLPVSASAFMVAVGIIEVVVALMLLTKFTRLGAYISAAWLILISINLILGGYIDIAIRDILLAVGAFVLAELTFAVNTRSKIDVH